MLIESGWLKSRSCLSFVSHLMSTASAPAGDREAEVLFDFRLVSAKAFHMDNSTF